MTSKVQPAATVDRENERGCVIFGELQKQRAKWLRSGEGNITAQVLNDKDSEKTKKWTKQRNNIA